MSQKIWTLSKNWTFSSIMMTMDIFSRFLPFQFRPRSKNIFDGYLRWSTTVITFCATPVVLRLVHRFMDMTLIFEHFERTDQLCSLKLFNARTIKDLVLEIFKHFLLQLNKNNKTVEIYENFALLTC